MDTPRNSLDTAAMRICRLANPQIRTADQLDYHWDTVLSMRARVTYRQAALDVFHDLAPQGSVLQELKPRGV